MLGLLGVHGLAETAARVTAPVRFLLQWDDNLVPRAQGSALFDALASADKTLHANPGKPGRFPSSRPAARCDSSPGTSVRVATS
ncbi:hypothetical protein [Streptosporangium sandarakinum]|uniref:hypothetical protein n=1 Tax=Streptosporangium sandarakinum TaxID=1260955 RepID=UPI003714A414